MLHKSKEFSPDKTSLGTISASRVQDPKEQIKSGLAQAFLREVGAYANSCIVIRWINLVNRDVEKVGSSIFRVELFDLSIEKYYYQQWEMKGNELVNLEDLKLTNSNFGLGGSIFADWWQDIQGEALDLSKNESLAKAVTIASRESQLKLIDMYNVSIRVCVNLRKGCDSIEYVINADAQNEKLQKIEVDWHVIYHLNFKMCSLLRTDIKLEQSVELTEVVISTKEFLVSSGRLSLLEDYLIDYYKLKEVEKYAGMKKGIMTIEIMLLTLKKKITILNVKISKQKKGGFGLVELKFESTTTKGMDSLMKTGTKFEKWETLPEKFYDFKGPFLKKIVDPCFKKINSQWKIEEIKLVEARVWRDPEDLKILKGFEFRVHVLLSAKIGPEKIEDEWITRGDPYDEKDMQFVGISKFWESCYRRIYESPKLRFAKIMNHSNSPNKTFEKLNNSDVMADRRPNILIGGSGMIFQNPAPNKVIMNPETRARTTIPGKKQIGHLFHSPKKISKATIPRVEERLIRASLEKKSPPMRGATQSPQGRAMPLRLEPIPGISNETFKDLSHSTLPGNAAKESKEAFIPLGVIIDSCDTDRKRKSPKSPQKNITIDLEGRSPPRIMKNNKTPTSILKFTVFPAAY